MATKVLSIEVGMKSTKVCELDFGKKNPCVYNTLIFQNPENSVEDGIIRDKETFSAVLQENLNKAGMRNTNVIFTITSNKIATREVIIPYVSDKKIQGIINSSVSEYFPMDLSDYTISYRVLEKRNHKDDKSISVLVLAAPVELIRSYYNTAKLLKLHIMNLDYIGNSYFHVINKEVGKGVNIAIHIDEMNSIVSIIDNGNLALQRIIGFGTHNLTQAIIDEPVLEKDTEEEAFAYLCNETVLNYQFAKSESKEPVSFQVGYEGFNKAKAEQRAKEDVTLVVQELLRNVARILDYYNSKSAGRNIAAIYVTGFGANINGIVRLMNNELGIEVKKVDHYYSIHTTKEIGHSKENITEYAACIGGVLQPIGFSLPEVLNNQAKKSNRTTMMVIFGASALLSVVLIAVSVFQKKMAEDDKKAYENRINSKQYVNSVYEERTIAQQQLTQYQDMHKLSITPNEFLHELLTELEMKMPSTMMIESLNVSDTGVISMDMLCLDEDSIGQLLLNLHEIPYIKNSFIPSYQKNEEEESGIVFYDYTLETEYAVDGTEDKNSFIVQ